MFSQSTCVIIAYHLSYLLHAISVLQDERSRFAHSYTTDHVDGSQFAPLLDFSIEGRLTHVKLVSQHFHVEVLVC